MKIRKLDFWSMEYNLTFVHIKGTDNILRYHLYVTDTGHIHGATREFKDSSI